MGFNSFNSKEFRYETIETHALAFLTHILSIGGVDHEGKKYATYMYNGRYISKANDVVFISPKKRTKKIQPEVSLYP